MAIRFFMAMDSRTAVALAPSISKNTALVVDVYLPATFPNSTPTFPLSILSPTRQLVPPCDQMVPLLATTSLHTTLLLSRAFLRALTIPDPRIIPMAASHTNALVRSADVEVVPQD